MGIGGREQSHVHLLARAYQMVRRQRCDFHHKTALALVRQYDTIYLEDLQIANMSRRPAPKPDGTAAICPMAPPPKRASIKAFKTLGGSLFARYLFARQHGPASRWSRCPRRTLRMCAAGVGRWCARASACARIAVLTVGSSWTATRTRPETFNGLGRPFGDSLEYRRE
jgi:putative transposase